MELFPSYFRVSARYIRRRIQGRARLLRPDISVVMLLFLGTNLDRPARARRSELHDPNRVVRRIVDVEREADLVNLEGLIRVEGRPLSAAVP